MKIILSGFLALVGLVLDLGAATTNTPAPQLTKQEAVSNSPTPSALPQWLAIVNTLILGIAGGVISAKQYKLAVLKFDNDQKLAALKFRQDMHDRRLKVYVATQTFIRKCDCRGVKSEDVEEFRNIIFEGRFWFDDSMGEYLNELHSKGSELRRALAELEFVNMLSQDAPPRPVPPAVRMLSDWFRNQPDKALKNFHPHMSLA